MTDLEQKYASLNVPRYTSYPTAPHFSEAVTPSLYGEWLESIPRDTPLSLYLHVPFCQEMCHYCGCNTKATRKMAPVLAYVELMLKEIDLVLKRLGTGREVHHIHWGGGTPSLVPREAFLKIVDKLKANFVFSEDIEHAIELDPRTVGDYLAETLKMAGITRTSLGVQDFDEDVQKQIGRIQPYNTVKKAVTALRNVGLHDINFDLMYGLPGQSEKTIRETVEYTKELAPGRVALFGYAHVPWFKKHQQLIKEENLPGANERIRLSDVSRDALVEAGYEVIGLDHFALPTDEMAIALKEGRLRRNFQGYTTDTADTLIGFGCSSIGFLPQGYIQTTPSAREWERMVVDDVLPIKKGIAVDKVDLCRAEIIMQLMTYYEVDYAATAEKHGLPVSEFASIPADMQEMIADGVATLEGTVVTVTDAGRRYVRVVAAAFDTYLATQQARHSVAV
ncbi:Oxygen-independent coproporphyrinogen III oxidase [Pseudovibrio sp. FO-BEG1]|uniref:Coproporphyrinogen-III oxidase n=1 Tax=Pseudovibrio denitrificans TaxID=258256 RepID=A0A1I7CB86_9HYPH|nr:MULTISPECIES: oxygen-independent coproporphyrinogen III oxidase [Pseudovibrio]AEV36271.1 Oxygen-independent coproporphyrinogen III oxidase [Pseudovibrio sp. FO-BEG1]EEA94316.1 oxygen-independent coproporphyrinogen III oxidase [Pseudovibrio sp. JE062]SFT96686.1 oxygen-independent coproporphyrinogen-3 oxidase [Pseudovibrio denitrificans]